MYDFGNRSGVFLSAVEAIPLHHPQALMAWELVLAEEPRTRPHIELLPLGAVAECAPEIGGQPEVHLENEEVLLPRRDVLLLQIVVPGCTMHRESPGQLVLNSDRHLGVGQRGRRYQET